jgi:signal transduction histidine kinase
MGMRGQLNRLVAATMALVLLAFLVPLGVLLRRGAEERAIASAKLEAQSAAALVSLGQSPLSGDNSAGVVVTVFYADGRIAGRPADRTSSVALAATGRAFLAESGHGVEVLVPVQASTGGTSVVRAYAPESLLHRGVARTWAVLGLLGLTLFLLGLLLADRLGRRLVGSVGRLATAADRLAGGDLAARVAPSGPPELRRVGRQLNHLAGRIQELLAAQREEAADLAHRLRTPVAALRLDVDSLADQDARVRLAADVDALGRQVDEVIRTARRAGRDGAGAATDLVAVTAGRVAFWAALAEDSDRPLEWDRPAGRLPVRASTEDLAAALDAVLGNVFSHTPDGTPLRVEVAATADGGGRVSVADAGGGLPPALAARGVSASGSTGLGLDIARRTAESAGGTLRTGTSHLGGALVELTFGPPAP